MRRKGILNEYFRRDDIKVIEDALEISRMYAAFSPEDYLPDMAKTLNTLGDLYRDIKENIKAEIRYLEALDILRKLAADNPEVYLADMVTTLSNLGFLYRKNMRKKRISEVYAKEALDILLSMPDRTPQLDELLKETLEVLK